ncbi:hypothetical protein HPP92_011975 [Vanilla planifolia]|uniref:F-box domain-containing protein n=1 Tax=Vanilla planifolia TaxID=51239 RepID=A0A835R1M5_VANPL|nr:hypothetical protein HPP92_011975 [Vanilla planifolia]
MARGLKRIGSTELHSGCWEVPSSPRFKANITIRKRNTPTKSRDCSSRGFHPEFNDGPIQGGEESTVLDLLPPEVLVNILSKVQHSDLQHLLLVSKFVKEAAEVARETHFLYSTPLPKPAFNCGLDPSDSDVKGSPITLKQRWAFRSRLQESRLSSLCIKLFGDL